ncbi:MAG: hypothetical protein ABJP45_18090 [Cyclobacteriaceae bacterium]
MKKLFALTFCIACARMTTIAQDLSTNQTQIIMDSTLNSSLFVCKLTGPELQKRKAALQKEIFERVEKVTEAENGYIFYFKDEGDFIEKLVDYTLAEKKCCPFFQFDLTIRPDNEGIEWKLSGPDGAKEIMKDLFVR